jgi:IS605 OrfB family transposase
MNTIKLPYNTSKENKNIILKFMKNQNNVIKFLYNRLTKDKNLSQIQLTNLSNSMNNVFIDSWFKQSAIYKARDLIAKNEKIIFGGKKLFFQRMNNKINKEDFNLQKLLPLYSIGESSKNSNRKFNFEIIENNKIIFKPHRSIKINLTLPKLRKNYQKILYKLQEKSEQKSLPITISLDLNFIYISYDELCLIQQKEIKVKDRIMSIDMNPNFIGYSVIDWKKNNEKEIIKTGIVSIKELNDREFQLKVSSEDKRMKYIHNKRRFEIFEIVKMLVNLAKVYKVECFVIEDLSIKSKDKLKGSRFNRLVNNMWCRNVFESNIEKRLRLSGIKLYRVFAQYSSFIGNVLNSEYVDCIASSIEISRRCYCFKNKIRPVIFPSFVDFVNVIAKSLEEFSNGQYKLTKGIKSWRDLYIQVKNSKMRYRVSLESCKKLFKVLRLFDKKSHIILYDFISN